MGFTPSARHLRDLMDRFMESPLVNPASPPTERTSMETAHLAFVRWVQAPNAVGAAVHITPSRYTHLHDFEDTDFSPLNILHWTTAERCTVTYSVIGFYLCEQQHVYGQTL